MQMQQQHASSKNNPRSTADCWLTGVAFGVAAKVADVAAGGIVLAGGRRACE